MQHQKTLEEQGGDKLVEAAASGDLDVVKNLVDVHKVNVEQRSRDGRTAMTAAAANGHLNVVEWLRDEFGHDNQEAALQNVTTQMVAKFNFSNLI